MLVRSTVPAPSANIHYGKTRSPYRPQPEPCFVVQMIKDNNCTCIYVTHTCMFIYTGVHSHSQSIISFRYQKCNMGEAVQYAHFSLQPLTCKDIEHLLTITAQQQQHHRNPIQFNSFPTHKRNPILGESLKVTRIPKNTIPPPQTQVTK
jgi:hypothetical protein